MVSEGNNRTDDLVSVLQTFLLKKLNGHISSLFEILEIDNLAN